MQHKCNRARAHSSAGFPSSHSIQLVDLDGRVESILQQQKSELKSEIYQDLIRDYHKAKTDKDDELRRKIGAILNNTYLKKITFN